MCVGNPCQNTLTLTLILTLTLNLTATTTATLTATIIPDNIHALPIKRINENHTDGLETDKNIRGNEKLKKLEKGEKGESCGSDISGKLSNFFTPNGDPIKPLKRLLGPSLNSSLEPPLEPSLEPPFGFLAIDNDSDRNSDRISDRISVQTVVSGSSRTLVNVSSRRGTPSPTLITDSNPPPTQDTTLKAARKSPPYPKTTPSTPNTSPPSSFLINTNPNHNPNPVVTPVPNTYTNLTPSTTPNTPTISRVMTPCETPRMVSVSDRVRARLGSYVCGDQRRLGLVTLDPNPHFQITLSYP
jgi:hypothetical protein